MSYRKINNTLTAKISEIPKFPNLIKENEDGFIMSSEQASTYKSTWSRTTLIPAATVEETIGETGTNLWSGQLQVDIFTPTGQGSDEADYFVDEIVKALPHREFLDVDGEDWSVHVITVSRVLSRQSTNFYMVPVVIQFEAYIPR